MPDLESGFSRDLFLNWCNNSRNSVIFTSHPEPGSLGHDLIVNGTDRVVELDVKKRVKLTGSELEDFRRREKEEQMNRSRQKDDLLMMEDESSDEEMEMVVTQGGKTIIKHDIIMKAGSGQAPSADGKQQTGFFKTEKALRKLVFFRVSQISEKIFFFSLEDRPRGVSILEITFSS